MEWKMKLENKRVGKIDESICFAEAQLFSEKTTLQIFGYAMSFSELN